jgi:hypothetical protein
MIDHTRRHTVKARTLLQITNPDIIAPLLEVNGFERLRAADLMNNNRINKLNSHLIINNDKDHNKLIQPFVHSKYLEEKSLSSFQSNLLFVFTLVISSLQFSAYRYLINNNLKYLHGKEIFSTNILDEITIFCWRIQSIFLLLVFYCILSSLFKFNFPFYPIYSNGVEPENSSSNKLFSYENCKFSSANLISSFVLYYSTKFLPLGLVTFFNLFDVLSAVKYNRNSNKFNTILNGLFYVGIILISFFIYKNDFTLDFNNYGMNMLICLILCFGSLFLTKFVFRPIFEEKMMKHVSPLRIIISLYLNNFIFSFLFFSLIQIYNDYLNLYNLIGWIFDFNLFIHFGVIIGFLGLAFLFLCFISIYYLDTEVLKTLKYAEVPLIDLFGFYVFGLYFNLNWLIFYLVGMIQFLFGMFVKDFVIEREKENHHDEKKVKIRYEF